MRASFAVVIAFAGGTAAAAPPFPSAWLPREGDGYVIPPSWAERGLRYGTPELVGLVERAASEVADEVPGALLYVADLSLKSGATTQWHRSHRNGCDADLIYFAEDDAGHPRPLPSKMVPFDDDGIAWTSDRHGDHVRLHFDTPRNWALVRALVLDETTPVQYLFMADALRNRLLSYADNIGESPEVMRRAASVMVQPSDSEAHDDHMHLRIEAPAGVEPIYASAYARTVVKKADKAHRGKPKAMVRHKKKLKKRARDSA